MTVATSSSGRAPAPGDLPAAGGSASARIDRQLTLGALQKIDGIADAFGHDRSGPPPQRRRHRALVALLGVDPGDHQLGARGLQGTCRGRQPLSALQRALQPGQPGRGQLAAMRQLIQRGPGRPVGLGGGGFGLGRRGGGRRAAASSAAAASPASAAPSASGAGVLEIARRSSLARSRDVCSCLVWAASRAGRLLCLATGGRDLPLRVGQRTAGIERRRQSGLGLCRQRTLSLDVTDAQRRTSAAAWSAARDPRPTPRSSGWRRHEPLGGGQLAGRGRDRASPPLAPLVRPGDPSRSRAVSKA